jgi:hypothetical protein
MSETYPGGIYIGADGMPHDANGKPIKVTAALKRELKKLGIELPRLSEPEPEPEPEAESEPEEEEEG